LITKNKDFDMPIPGLIKGLIEGGLKGLGDTAKGIIQQVGENKLGVAEAALAIEKEANRASEAITEQANDLEKSYLADIQNARETNAKIQGDSPSWLAKNVAYMIDIFIVLIWGALTAYVLASMLHLVAKVQGVDYTGVTAIWGGVTALATQIIGFHRGSSQGSADKQKLLDKMVSR
jgi:hypothetical protein